MIYNKINGEGYLKPALRFQKELIQILIKDGYIKEDKIKDLEKERLELEKLINQIIKKENRN